MALIAFVARKVRGNVTLYSGASYDKQPGTFDVQSEITGIGIAQKQKIESLYQKECSRKQSGYWIWRPDTIQKKG